MLNHDLSPLRPLKNERGVALLMALFSIMILMVVATEIMYQTTVEAKVSSQSVNEVKAYYSAKAAVELGLLRVFAYRSVVASIGDSIPDKSILDMIYTFPLAWPPNLGDNVSGITKDAIGKTTKESLVKGNWTMNIDAEGAKIDINDLASPSKVVAEATKKQIVQILEGEIKNNEEFQKNNRNLEVNKLVGNITDWIDEDSNSSTGGDEKSPYADLQNDNIPPNQPMKTIEELHMVSGMTDEIYNLLAPRLTVFGTKGININHANKEVLMSLDPSINEDAANKIIEARNKPDRGPFKNLEDFIGFLQTLQNVSTGNLVDGKEAKVPMIFDAEYNFRIVGTGKAGPVIKTITAVTYDYDAVKDRLGDFLAKQRDQENKDAGAQPTPTPTPTPDPAGGQGAAGGAKPDDKKKTALPKGRPNVVYWVES